MYKLKTIFVDDWQYIMETYTNFLYPSGCETVNEELLLMLVEIGVRFGERISRLGLNGYVEIGCGLAIPSLTLAKLRQKRVKAIDIDPNILLSAGALKNHLECEVDFECYDIFANRPELSKDKILIAEKPASYEKNALEVEHTIRNWCSIKGINLALIPSYVNGDTLASYSERCEKYEKKFKQVGFKVENKQIYDPLPYRWIIATK